MSRKEPKPLKKQTSSATADKSAATPCKATTPLTPISMDTRSTTAAHDTSVAPTSPPYGVELIMRYFPDLTSTQQHQFAALDALYREWNAKINVISRKDIDLLYLHHVLHSLAIARFCRFAAGARILDVGCGGGFPGIPLAILFPEARFTLVDSIGKKIKVVNAVAEAIGLQNLSAHQARVETLQEKFDFVISRAVTEMKPFIGWVWNKIERGNRAGSLANGILYLKGGDLEAELNATGKAYTLYDIHEQFTEPFFETKKVVYFPR